jgi:transcriptional regulator with XRE-family HTH domain
MTDELKYVLSMLKDANIAAVARNTGISYRTVLKIANGKHSDPPYSTVKTLADHFRGKE